MTAVITDADKVRAGMAGEIELWRESQIFGETTRKHRVERSVY